MSMWKSAYERTSVVASKHDCPECDAKDGVIEGRERAMCQACGFDWTRKQWASLKRKDEKGLTRDFVRRWLEEHCAIYDYRTAGIRIDGDMQATRPDLLVLRIYSDGEDKGYALERIRAEISLYCQEKDLQYRLDWREWAMLPAIPDARAMARRDLRKWLRAVCGESAEGLSYVVMLHWMWCVKRKIAGLPAEQHLMIVLQGRSGGGKSVAITKFLEPLAALVGKGNLSALSDERHWFRFERDFVIFLDELGKAQRADIDTVKDVITSDTLEYRVLGVNARHVIQQNAMFVGASNRPLVDVLKDQTSGRRFWEVRAQDRLDWDVVNKTDYDGIWRDCVSPEDPPPLRGRWARHIASAQHKHLRQRTWAEIYLDQYEWDRDGEGMRSDDLWADIRWYREEAGMKPIDKHAALTQIGRACSYRWGKGFVKGRLRDGQGRVQTYPLRRVDSAT